MKKFVRRVSFALLVFASLLLTGCMTQDNSQLGTANVGPLVEQWRQDVENYARMYGMEEYVELILAIIAQETGGDSDRYPDIMQSSESKGDNPNTIVSPQESMDQGIRYLAGLFERGKQKGVDTNTVIQSYNFGGGFIDYIATHYNGTYTQEAAASFSQFMCQKLGWNNYGDVLYVEHVTSKLKQLEHADGITDFASLEAAFLQYEGVPYVYGGASMQGIDCSALTQNSYRAIGITLPRTAQEQYDKVEHISNAEAKPGDLVFFQGTAQSSNVITHVGIYVGNQQMFHASSTYNACRYAAINTPYYEAHLAGFGRVK